MPARCYSGDMDDEATLRAGDLLDPVLNIAGHAGEKILEIYQTDFKVVAKADETPLTRADLAAHHAIELGLQALTPQWPVLSEESDAIDFQVRRQWQRYWLVDPLDGTREFVRKSDEFCVNVALIDQGRPILGVIYAPVTGQAWYAARGRGAWKRRRGQKRGRRLRCRKVDAVPTLAGSNSRGGPRTRAYLEALGEHHMMRQGSAIKFGLIAEGRADLYLRLGLTSEWDTAAGQCLLEEAGGQVTDLKRRPLIYNARKSLLNPDFLAFGDASEDWTRYLSSAGASS